MNPELQHKFETQILEKGFTTDRRIFNKDKKGIYTNEITWWMYRVWVSKEVEINVLIEKHKRDVEECFQLGYTGAENDYRLRRI